MKVSEYFTRILQKESTVTPVYSVNGDLKNVKLFFKFDFMEYK